MPAIGAPLRKWTTFLLLCSSLPALAQQPTNETTPTPTSTAVHSSSASSGTSISSVSPRTTSVASSQKSVPATTYTESTCPFRTINYITHTLPQQCLKTSWSGLAQTAVVEGSEGGAEATVTESPRTQPIREDSRARPSESGQQKENDSNVQQPEQSVAEKPAGTGSDPEPEAEADSPLDNANFLSFEDWKKKNLARAGQSPENVGQGRAGSSETRNRRRPVNINALDALGEESEIELDFSGFGNVVGDSNDSGSPSGTQEDTDSTRATDDEGKIAPTSFSLSKDAGKTCKERFNYASFDCAATVLKTNKKAKSSSALLVENKDSYMLNECSADNKFVIVELCDDILLDTVVLANFEFFSSMFRHFRVSVSDRYPVKMDRWRTLGEFEARNSRDLQPFLVKEPQIWARYLRIEFLTHYGNEFYCPISLIRVHGTTMMEQFRREEEEARGEDDFAEPIEAADGEPVETAVAVTDDDAEKSNEQVPPEPEKPIDNAAESPKQGVDISTAAEGVGTDNQSSHNAANSEGPDAASNPSAEPELSRNSTALSDAKTANVPPDAPSTVSSPPHGASEVNKTENTQADKTSRAESPSTTHKAASPSSQQSAAESKPAVSNASSNQDVKNASGKPSEQAPSVASGSVAGRSSTNSSSNGAQSQARSSSQTQPNPASPTTQESFFKSISKRLQQLEANSTLSLQYIEEQSRILRDAFIKVEKRQLAKTEKFLDHLNSTVMQELKSYRSMYDQLWQSTILELEGMKERQRTEIGEIGARLSLVADELVWQKRMAVVQSTLLLLCLGLVLFVRSGTLGSQSDVPIVQQLGSTYSRFFESPPMSPNPPTSGLLRRRRTFRNIWRSDTSAGLSSGHHSDGAETDRDGQRSPHMRIIQHNTANHTHNLPTPITPSGLSDLPTPNRHTGHLSPSLQTPLLAPSSASSIRTMSPAKSDSSEVTASPSHNAIQPEDSSDSDDQAKRIQFLATQSGPATPHGTRDTRPSWEEVDRAVDMLKAEEEGQQQETDEGGDSDVSAGLKGSRKGARSPLRRSSSYEDSTGTSGISSGGDVTD